MARRHESLTHLSRDHHDGLVLAGQILEQTRSTLPDWPSAPGKQASYVAQFFDCHLRGHFAAEEKLLFPLIVLHIPDAKTQVDDLLNDHRRMEIFVQELREPGNLPVAERLQAFAATLEQHIRKEERELFPLFEREAPVAVLAQAQALLSRGYPEE